MSAHVLLNLLNKLRKRDKLRGLPSILSLFHKEFNKFNNTRTKTLISGIKKLRFCYYVRNIVIELPKSVNH